MLGKGLENTFVYIPNCHTCLTFSISASFILYFPFRIFQIQMAYISCIFHGIVTKPSVIYKQHFCTFDNKIPRCLCATEQAVYKIKTHDTQSTNRQHKSTSVI